MEDQPEVRVLVREVLSRRGYSVIEAGAPLEALELVSSAVSPVHLLLTDVVLPQMPGWELAQLCRRIHPGLRVLYMSGYDPEGTGSSTLTGPDTAFLQKPFSVRDLLETVRALLDERHKKG